VEYKINELIVREDFKFTWDTCQDFGEQDYQSLEKSRLFFKMKNY
jgi:hypothetical protein